MKIIPDFFLNLFQKENNYIFPKEIILEVTNYCNLKCRHCHFHASKDLQKRKLGFMKRDIWERVLIELKEIDRPVTLVTHGAGEPLLYNQLFDLLESAKKIPNVSVGFMTNGMLLTKTWADKLIDLQLDFLAFSIDGVKSETNDFFRVNADLQKIEKNVSYLIEKKIKLNSEFPKLNFNMVGYPEILDQEMAYVNKWLPYAHSVTISTFRPIGSRKLWEGDIDLVPFKPCPLLWNQLVVSTNGKIGLCCEDINLTVPLGDINNHSVQKIYNRSTELLHYRKKHLSNNLKGLPLCQDCQSWAGDSIIEKQELLIEGIRIHCQETPSFKTYTKV